MNILQRLYDSEINWRISTFWDGGFQWELGAGPAGGGAAMTCSEARMAAFDGEMGC